MKAAPMPDPHKYERIPGRSSTINPMRSSLWLGDDHLLLVSHSFVAETYRRLPLKAIQAIVTTGTGRGRIYNRVLGAIAALLLVATILTGLFSPLFCIAPGSQLGVVLILILINIARGPTCRTELRTAVQTVELGALCRLKRTRKAMAMIASRIETVQGAVSAQALAELNAADASVAASMQVAPASPRLSSGTPRKPTVLTYCRGRAHSVLFWTTVGIGLCSLVTLLVPSAIGGISILTIALLFLLFGCGIGAGVSQSGSSMPLRLKILTWTIPGYHAFTLLITIVLTIAVFVIHFSGDGSTSQITDHIAFKTFAMVDFALSALQGSFGLVWLERYRSTATPPATDHNE